MRALLSSGDGSRCRCWQDRGRKGNGRNVAQRQISQMQIDLVPAESFEKSVAPLTFMLERLSCKPGRQRILGDHIIGNRGAL